MCEPETTIEPNIYEPNLVALEIVRKFISPHSDELDESEGFLVGQLSLNQIPLPNAVKKADMLPMFVFFSYPSLSDFQKFQTGNP